MTWFILVTMLIGVVVALGRQSWAVLLVAGAVLLPFGVGGLMIGGAGFWPALGQTFIGLVAMQAAFLASAWTLEAWRRRAPTLAERNDRPPRAGEG